MITIRLQHKVMSNGDLTDTIFIDTPILAGHMFKVMDKDTMSNPGLFMARMTESICGLEPGACERMALTDYVAISSALEPWLKDVVR